MQTSQAEQATASAGVTSYAESLNTSLCKLYKEPFRRGVLTQPLGRDEAAALVLDVMREHAVNNVDLLTSAPCGSPERCSDPPAWYLPQPYTDIFVESELTRPETRRYHHLQLLPTAGLRFELFPQFSLYAGGDATWEVFAEHGSESAGSSGGGRAGGRLAVETDEDREAGSEVARGRDQPRLLDS